MILFDHAAAKEKTAQGHEIQAGTNVLGHNHLTELLKPALIEAASHSEKGSVRIVFVSSSAHCFYYNKQMKKKWDMGDAFANELKPDALYGRSKLGNVHQMQYFANELEEKGIIVSAVHPGNIRSELRECISGSASFLRC
jgi:retinol dehydrogenase-12